MEVLGFAGESWAQLDLTGYSYPPACSPGHVESCGRLRPVVFGLNTLDFVYCLVSHTAHLHHCLYLGFSRYPGLVVVLGSYLDDRNHGVVTGKSVYDRLSLVT